MSYDIEAQEASEASPTQDGGDPKIQLLNDNNRISLKRLLCGDHFLFTIYSLIIQKTGICGNKGACKPGAPEPSTPSAVYPLVAIWNQQHRPGWVPEGTECS